MRLLGRKHYVPAGANEITKKLGLGQEQAREVRRELRGLLRSGRVVRLPDKRFALPAEEDLIAGRILMNRRGGGRVVTTANSGSEEAWCAVEFNTARVGSGSGVS